MRVVAQQRRRVSYRVAVRRGPKTKSVKYFSGHPAGMIVNPETGGWINPETGETWVNPEG